MRTARPLLALFLAPLLLASGSALAGEIYTWKDDKGVTHYSDIKPESDKVKVLKAGTQRDLPGTPAGTSATATKGKQESVAVDPETAFRKRRAEAAEAQAKADKEKREADARKESCDAVGSQLTALKSGERMARYNAAGEKEVLDDAARDAEIGRLQRIMDGSCR